MAQVVAEPRDDIGTDKGEGKSAYSLPPCGRSPKLEALLHEALRLHPPLIILMRVAQQDIEVEGHIVHKGQSIAVSPAVPQSARTRP